jgi:hypothetical protein
MTESGASRDMTAAAAGRVSEWLSRSRISFCPDTRCPWMKPEIRLQSDRSPEVRPSPETVCGRSPGRVTPPPWSLPFRTPPEVEPKDAGQRAALGVRVADEVFAVERVQGDVRPVPTFVRRGCLSDALGLRRTAAGSS